MKVLMFSGDYWPDAGGIASHVGHMARALTRQGIRVTVIGGHLKPVRQVSVGESSQSKNLHEVMIRRTGPRGVRLAWFLLRAYRELSRMASQEWDIVHYHNFVPDGILLGLSNWPRAVERVMTNHSDVLLRALDKGTSLAPFRLLLRSVTGVIAPSQELKEKSELLLRQGQRCTYIPNGVDVSVFTPGPVEPHFLAALGVGSGNKVILATRRHDPKCGLDLLLRAVPLVIRAHPEAIFCLIGDGPQTSALRRLSVELGVDKWVRFQGYIQHDRLPGYYRASYLSVLPSVYEAVSLSGLESLACATPVIGTKVGGIPEFVHDGRTGVLVEPGSPSELARAITWMLEHPGVRETMAAEGPREVSANFSWEKAAMSTVSFYSELLESTETRAG